ncbi:hypothetical protein PR003_g11083 [Phytophthora rubi]|uniref:Uncharacterized protein n=1 Tax=Phytophthora rubi TaxID=129364 RepID=A0A6A4FBX1_9STRA|nr:hypothetical protein PR001_g8955 [Phytophthora rubi]KAE9339307.1 hypothetical protein PR003_g11083 [Phytophthora rubi]
MQVVRSGNASVVATVEYYQAAWWAGVEVGDHVKAFNLTGELNPPGLWTDDALATVNMHRTGKKFGLQAWKDHNVEELRKIRFENFQYNKMSSRHSPEGDGAVQPVQGGR